MNRHPRPPVARGLFVGLDVLTGALVVVAVVAAPAGSRAPAALAAVVLLGVYVWGRLTVRVQQRPISAPRGAWWPDTTWILALLLPWAVLLWLTPGALWIAFPLMFLQMHVLGPHRGPLMVLATAALAIAEGLLVQVSPGDSWTGFVLGPLFGAAVAIGVVLGLEALVRESEARQRTVEELTAARLHLAAADRENAVAAERERVARDIHDTVAQSLTAIELLLRTAEPAIGADDARARRLVDQARTAAQDSLADARRLVEDLTPADLHRTTLVGALRRVAGRTATASSDDATPLTVDVETCGEPRALPVPVETAVLRIAQSALANVSRHADAAHARLTLTYEPERVTLDVVDDGHGFDPAVSPTRGSGSGGFGLPAIRSRVHELAGTVVLESAPGRGTALAVTFPVHEAGPPPGATVPDPEVTA
ncbi:sensor histidine kinase [Paraoerskovia marina]|uniref:sensor histidine kinase n=1 Tax=Paraoerskovia marina TaxID=545619 RepID=UPI0012DE4D74|nr:sensor histidine kinase [Paraoerskovia marina]